MIDENLDEYGHPKNVTGFGQMPESGAQMEAALVQRQAPFSLVQRREVGQISAVEFRLARHLNHVERLDAIILEEMLQPFISVQSGEILSPVIHQIRTR